MTFNRSIAFLCGVKIRSLLLFFASLVVFSSCNLPAMVDRHQKRKMARKGFPSYSYLTPDGARHHVHAHLQGKPKLVLLHGYGASGTGQYYTAAKALSKDYDVILPDLLYCGHSFGNRKDYTIPDQVAHLKLLLDTLGVKDSITIIGNSYGGIVASYFAEAYPERVVKLGIYDSPINFYSSKYADSLAQSLGVESVRNLLSPLNVRENKISLDLVFFDQPYIPKFVRRQMVEKGSLPMREHQVQLLEYLISKEDEMNLHRFKWKADVFVLWGDHDRLIPMQTCQSIIKEYQVPEDHVFIFKNAAHAANIEYKKEFVEVVREIMKK